MSVFLTPNQSHMLRRIRSMLMLGESQLVAEFSDLVELLEAARHCDSCGNVGHFTSDTCDPCLELEAGAECQEAH